MRARRLPGGRFYTEPRDAVWDFTVSLRLPYYFWLGARGYAGALAWLAVLLADFGRTEAKIGQNAMPRSIAGQQRVITIRRVTKILP